MAFEDNSFDTNSFSIGSWLFDLVESGYRLVSAVGNLVFNTRSTEIGQTGSDLEINQRTQLIEKDQGDGSC